jgi:hypothetical protein
MRAVNRELPFEVKVTLSASARARRNDRNEKGAGLDLLPDRRIPGVAAPELTLIEPDLNPSGAQACADLRSRIGILGGVA